MYRRLGTKLMIAAIIVLGLGLMTAPVSSTHQDPPAHPDSNHAESWENWLHDGSECEKVLDEDAEFYTLEEAPEGFEWTLIVVNAGPPGPDRSTITLNPEPGEYENAQTGDVSNVILCKKEQPEDLILTVTKRWRGDDHGDATATFTIDGEALTSGGVSVVHGQTVVIDETVDGLPDNCRVIRTRPRLPHSYTVNAEDAVEGLITITVINRVRCEEEPEPRTVTFHKVFIDAEGNLLFGDDRPTDTGFTVLITDSEGTVVATLNDSNLTAEFAAEVGAKFTVFEVTPGEGWVQRTVGIAEVPCLDVGQTVTVAPEDAEEQIRENVFQVCNEQEPEEPREPENDNGDVLGDRTVVRQGEVLGTSTQVSVTPTGGVKAGGGGAAGIALSSLLGMGGSIATLSMGALRLRKSK